MAAAPAWAQVTFTKSFTDDPVLAGDQVTLSYTITNNGILPTAALTFTDDLDAALSGLAATGSPNITLCAGASITLGTTTITYVGVALTGGASCTFTVTLDVPSSASPGTYPSTTSALTTALLVPVAPPATDNLVVLGPPTFSKAFSPSSIAVSGISTLTFTIDNSLNAQSATALDFSDALPAGVQIAPTPAASTTCTGGALAAAANDTAINYSGGSVGASSICTVQVNVTATGAGSFDNTSGDLTSSLGNSGPASATLDASATPVPPLFSKAFSPSAVAIGGVSTLTFTIGNSGNVVDADNLDFTDNLPAGLQVAATPNASTTCTAGTLTATGGTTAISYSGGTVTAGATCTVSADVVATTVGGHANTSGDLTSSLGNSGPASASLSAAAAPLIFSIAFSPSTIPAGEITTLTFTIDNSANAVAATALTFTDNLPASLEIAPTPNVAVTCTGGTVTAVAGSATFDYAGGTVGANAACTLSVDILATTAGAYTNVAGPLASSFGNAGTATATLTVGISNDEIVSRTQSAIRHFMSRRADLITMEEPDLTERLDASGPRLPVDVQASYTPDGMVLNFATSLSQMRGAISELNATYSDEANSLRALGYADAVRVPPEPLRFDIWTEGTYTSYRDSESGDETGSFGLVYIGGEWRVRPNFVIGMLAQIDAMAERDDNTDIEASGTGWMAGPYVAGRFGSSSFFQMRGAYGQSSNDISPFGTYEDTFETTRWLVSGKFKQRFTFGSWRLTPSAGLIYFNDEQQSYTDDNGLLIPSQTVALGRITFGPEIAYRGEMSNGMFFEPSIGLTGVWDFASDGTSETVAVGDDAMRARLTGGLAVGSPRGGRFSMSAFYDGIGSEDFSAYGGKFKLSLPLGGS